ncbi:MAG: copper ion binding protein [Erysipelotrichaceae bacterium]|nr:copper ion binding protein [Erysipelotrichaceae bacterium]MDP3306048.1 copper ion binding protein [Erysipelotrichaceae bacterium]
MLKKLSIEGMSCNHCVKRVESGISELPGVKSVKVNLGSKSALVETEEEFDVQLLFNAVDEAGYDLIKVEVQ